MYMVTGTANRERLILQYYNNRFKKYNLFIMARARSRVYTFIIFVIYLYVCDL